MNINIAVYRIVSENKTKYAVFIVGFVITNPSRRLIHVTTNIGVTVKWNGINSVTVTVPGQYKGKTCGLCGNNNGNAADDVINLADYPCVPPVGDCVATADVVPFIKKCDLMKKSPFITCNGVVNPADFIQDCKFDACRCPDPMDCVCNSFAAYSRSCSQNSVVLKWRSGGNDLVSGLSQCGMYMMRIIYLVMQRVKSK